LTDTTTFLATRRSIPIPLLAAPAPEGAELDQILQIASRVPDHGKLAPWRFILYRGDAAIDLGKALAELAEAGECALLNVELDLPEGEDVPRIAIRSVRPLARLNEATPLALDIAVTHEDALPGIARLLETRGEGRDCAVMRVLAGDSELARVALGTAFNIDADLAALIGRIPGVFETGITTLPLTGLA